MERNKKKRKNKFSQEIFKAEFSHTPWSLMISCSQCQNTDLSKWNHAVWFVHLYACQRERWKYLIFLWANTSSVNGNKRSDTLQWSDRVCSNPTAACLRWTITSFPSNSKYNSFQGLNGSMLPQGKNRALEKIKRSIKHSKTLTIKLISTISKKLLTNTIKKTAWQLDFVC